MAEPKDHEPWLEELQLPEIGSTKDLAAHMGISWHEFRWLTNQGRAASADHYDRFSIPKRHGGERPISVPKRRLRRAQLWILDRLLAPVEPHPAAMAFRPGRSIVDNARLHAGKAVVVRIDLADFFHSIHFHRVAALFERLGYRATVATTLAWVTTERVPEINDRRLPQGAATSPAIANLVCRSLDETLASIAASQGFAYSRYADDLTFSHSSALPRAEVDAFLALIQHKVELQGFAVNEAKTQVMRPGQRQVVTGLVVNGQSTHEPRISRTDLRRFRAFLHRWETMGGDADGRAYALGYLGYVQMVCPAQAERIRAAHPELLGGPEPRAQRPSPEAT
ncbi:MAG: reverse transcriptase family protein [Chloroflexota bacterium]|nr:reverse transcriptase family protein [Chloroflexota bacterium]